MKSFRFPDGLFISTDKGNDDRQFSGTSEDRKYDRSGRAGAGKSAG